MFEPSLLLLRYALPLLLLAALIEASWLIRRDARGYPWRQTWVTLQIAFGQRLIALLLGGLVLTVLTTFWEMRLVDIAMDSATDWVALFLGVEFCYYWLHRCSHTCRWFWATHVVHHTPERLVLSGALRLGWTGQATGVFLFFAPLAWLGFPPDRIALMLTANLLYQYWLHTDMVPPLGRLEGWINTPSAHRVHHARNPRYLDANFGGVLMVFDRLFGTYVAEDACDPCDYGLVSPIADASAVAVALGEWNAIGKDLRTTKNFRDAAGFLFRAPGWRPDGRGPTTANLRAAWLSPSANAPVSLDNTMNKLPLQLPIALVAAFSSPYALAAKPSADQVRALMATELPKRFAAADSNGDGRLTREEAKSAMPRVYKHFDLIDSEKNGYVTLADIEIAIENELLPKLSM